MSNANRHDIQVLNGLIRTTIDSADLYREAAEETADPGHADLFRRRDQERRHLANELGSNVRAMGGEPQTDGSILAKAQRAFMDVKHALLRDEVSVIGAVEDVEQTVKSRFEQALDDSRISATTRETIRRAWSRVRGQHDEMNDLRQSAESQRDASSGLFPH